MTPFLLFFLVLAVLGLVYRTRTLHDRLESLEREVRRIRHAEARSGPASRPDEPTVATVHAPPLEKEPDAPAEPLSPPRALPLEVIKAPTPAPKGTEAPAAPPPTAQPEPAEPIAASIDWERWVGIRGAAVVGGIALILAGIFFVQVAIERGWLGPAARDALALAIGALALGAHGPLRRRGLIPLADSLAGAGAVLMYGGAWAAAQLHDLVPSTVALAVMAATTAIALFTAARHRAPVVAAFALVGGFATPVLLGTLDRESTATLFGYLFVLNVSLLTLARRVGWKYIVPVALLGTFFLHLLWGEHQLGDPSPTWLVAALLGATTLLFTRELRPIRIMPRGVRRDQVEEAELLQLFTLGAPFGLFARHALSELDPTPSLWVVAAFCAVLICAAAFAARRFRSALYLGGSGVASALLLGLFHFRVQEFPQRGDADVAGFNAWAMCAVALTLVLLVASRWTGLRRARGSAFGFALFAIPIGAVSVFHANGELPDSLNVSFYLSTALLVLAGSYGATFAPRAQFSATLLGWITALSLFAHTVVIHEGGGSPDPRLSLHAAAFSAAAVALGSLALILRPIPRARPWAAAMSMTAAWIGIPGVLLALVSIDRRSPIEEVDLALRYGAASLAGTAFALAFLVQPARSRVGAGLRHAALLLASLAAVPLLFAVLDRGSITAAMPSTVRALTFAVFFAALPAAAALRVLRARPDVTGALRWVCWLSAVPMLIPIDNAFEAGRFLFTSAGETGALHATLLSCAALAALVGFLAERRDRVAAIPFFTVAAALAANSLARAVSEHEIIATAALALGTAAVLARRARSWNLTRLAAGAALIPTASLLTQTFVFRGFLAEAALVPTQLSIDFGIAVFGAIASAFAMTSAPKGDSLESSELSASLKVASVASVLALLFGWMNATVLNRFAEPGSRLALSAERMQARDLSLSIAWALFAGALLIVGMARHSSGLRWTSLWLFLAVILKVFLYDLSALTGLSRVASFGGLAVALMAVSLLYSKILGSSEGSAPRPNGNAPG